MRYTTVLFDLDGTLADTAPDLAAAANLLRTQRGMPALALAELRPFASAGARGLIGKAFGFGPEHPEFETLKDEFLANYEAALCVHTVLFEGVAEMLDTLEARGLKWGIVTNKVERFTHPLVKALQLDTRAAAVVSGNTTAHAKPHPLPLLHAAALASAQPETCLYVGDDLRDIQAGQAAAMGTVAAAYGYCGMVEVQDWHADHIIQHPLGLLDLLQ